MTTSSPAPQSARLQATIEGHVQGVGFRQFVLAKAEQLGLSGWVRNTYAGNVELAAEGDRAQLEALLDAVRRGPRGCFVTNVSYQWDTARGEFQQFQITRTV